MSTKFIRKIEDFVCEHCGYEVKGNGFTNHCPQCLWSKHVDVHPGDREASCGGLMEPVGTEIERGEFRIVHKCTRCGLEKRNKMAVKDNFDIAAAIAKKKGDKEQ